LLLVQFGFGFLSHGVELFFVVAVLGELDGGYHVVFGIDGCLDVVADCARAVFAQLDAVGVG
jgi:hypothetical protein